MSETRALIAELIRRYEILGLGCTNLEVQKLAWFWTPLDRTSELIDGFESPFGMELLATVDWLISKAGCSADVSNVRDGLAIWPAGRAAARRKRHFSTTG